MALTNKQQAFINEYLIDFNATRAAQRAGYSGDDNTLAATGSRLIRVDKIEEAIRTRLRESAMAADEVLMRLAENARADLGTWLSDEGDIDLAAMKQDGKTRMLRKVKRTRRTGETESGATWEETTIEVELHDQQAALVHIGKHHGLFSEQTQHSGEVIIRVKYGNEGTDRPAAPTTSETA